MKSEDIQIGSVVMLKSGGPFMTVVSVWNDVADCAYFDPHTDHYCRQTVTFPLACIELVDEDEFGGGDDGERVGEVVDFRQSEAA